MTLLMSLVYRICGNHVNGRMVALWDRVCFTFQLQCSVHQGVLETRDLLKDYIKHNEYITL